MTKPKKRFKQPPAPGAVQASLDAFELFGANEGVEEWTPKSMTPKPDYLVKYEYTGPRQTPKTNTDVLWEAIERLADSDPTPSPYAARR